MSDEAVVRKVQALLKLSKGNTTEAEAASAMAKAMELVKAHNLDMAILTGKEPGTRGKEQTRGYPARRAHQADGGREAGPRSRAGWRIHVHSSNSLIVHTIRGGCQL